MHVHACVHGYKQAHLSRSCDTFKDGNYFQADYAQTNCTACPAGTMRYSRIGNGTQQSDCRCKEGYWRHDQEPGQVCVQCPEGAQCDGGLDLPYSKEGWWAANGNYEFLQCNMKFKSIQDRKERRGEACIGNGACIDVVTADGTALVSGRACRACAGRVYQHTCEDCRNTLWGTNSKLLQAVIAFMIVIGWYA